jgi:hypothetical protein
MALTSRSRRQRGAAVFIVVMVLTLLAAIGIFAIRSASLVTLASGHNRQAMQTMQFAEYATRAAVAELGDPRLTSYYARLVDNSADQCLVNLRVTATGLVAPACYKLMLDEITRGVQQNYSDQALLDPQTAVADGSLGPRLTAAGDTESALEGVFAVEMHDLFDGPTPPGMKADDTQLGGKVLTLTTFAQIRMVGSGTAAFCAEQTTAPSASLHAVRAHVTLPLVVD